MATMSAEGAALLAGDHARVARAVVVVIAAVVVVVGADVAGLLRPFAFLLIGLDDRALDDLAAGGVDRVGDVGVQLGPAVGVAGARSSSSWPPHWLQ